MPAEYKAKTAGAAALGTSLQQQRAAIVKKTEQA